PWTWSPAVAVITVTPVAKRPSVRRNSVAGSTSGPDSVSITATGGTSSQGASPIPSGPPVTNTPPPGPSNSSGGSGAGADGPDLASLTAPAYTAPSGRGPSAPGERRVAHRVQAAFGVPREPERLEQRLRLAEHLLRDQGADADHLVAVVRIRHDV